MFVELLQCCSSMQPFCVGVINISAPPANIWTAHTANNTDLSKELRVMGFWQPLYNAWNRKLSTTHAECNDIQTPDFLVPSSQ